MFAVSVDATIDARLVRGLCCINDTRTRLFLRPFVCGPQPDWLVAQTFMGITTFYKMDPDGSVWIKMHGTMDDVGIMDQLATVREVDLFNKWVPFCKTSKLLKRLGIVELLVYFSVSMPGVSR